jgi:AcrR family transcriptional regulator
LATLDTAARADTVSTLREELMAAMVDLVDDRGYEAVSVEQVAARAGVSEAEFGALFASKDECALAILEEIGTTTVRNAQAAYDRGGSWPDSLRAVAYAQVSWMSENPKRTRFWMLEMLWANDLTRAARENLFKRFIAMVDGGREVAPDPEAIPPHAAEAAIGSITQMLTKRLQKRGETDPFAFIPELMYMAVLPYLGEEIAKKELTMPPPAGMPRR